MTHVVFRLTVDGLPEDFFQVVAFEGTEELARPYRFEIDVVSQSDSLEGQDIVAQGATFTMIRGTEARRISGIVWSVSLRGRAAGGRFAYRLVIMPPIALLQLSRVNRTFGTDKPASVIEVVSQVLTQSRRLGLNAPDFALNLIRPQAYPQRDLWIQYEETDFDFIHRLIEHWGIFYYFEPTELGEKIIFCNSTTLAPRQTIDPTLYFKAGANAPYQDRGIIESLHQDLTAISKSVRIRDYNPETPHIDMTVTDAVASGSFGEYNEYGTHFQNTKEGALFARIRAEEIASRRDRYTMVTTSPFLSPGYLATVEGHFRHAINRGYVITGVRHKGHQNAAGAFSNDALDTGLGYSNELTAITSDAPFRPARQTPRPMMAGVMPAFIDAPDDHDERAMLDSQGRYKIALDFDTGKLAPGERSPFIREIHPYGGSQTGMHFPMNKETEVMIGWMNGDPDRPLIMGAAPNPRNPSPVNSQNRTQNILRSASGMALVMDDGPAPTGDAAYQVRNYNEGTGTDVYTALIVPTEFNLPPNYLRLGDAVGKNRIEKQIIADPAFGTSLLPNYRHSTINATDYDGIFSYTAQNRTTTTGGNETAVVGGDHRMEVRGSSRTRVYGVQYDAVYAGAPPLPSRVAQASVTALSSEVPASASTSTDNASSSAARAEQVSPTYDVNETGTKLKVSVTTPVYTADVIWTPTLSYTYGASFAYTVGEVVTGSAGFTTDFAWSPIGGFSFSMGHAISLSGFPLGSLLSGSQYEFDASDGSILNGMSGFDSGFGRLTSEQIVLGYRSPAKSPMPSLKSWTNVMTVIATAAAAAGESLGALVMHQDSLDERGGTVLGTQHIATLAGVTAFAALTAKAAIYFKDGGVHSTLMQDTAEPTMTIDQNGIALVFGSSAIKITNAGIEIQGAKITLSTISAAVATPCFTATPTDLSINGAKIGVISQGALDLSASGAAGLIATGQLTLNGAPTNVGGVMTVTGDFTGQKVKATVLEADAGNFAKLAEVEARVEVVKQLDEATRLQIRATEQALSLQIAEEQAKQKAISEAVDLLNLAMQTLTVT